MERLEDPRQMQERAEEWRRSGATIGLVPTMGYFHEGHLRLMRLARQRCDVVVTSLFVNPIQFGPGEDLDRYPRDLERDAVLAAGAGVDLLFVPQARDMYPDGFQTTVEVAGLSAGLCGARRPGHFRGVATVVLKLLHLVKPHLAVFGEKDFQQLAVVRRMCLDLDLDVEILGHPIVREEDGLAMSSRNVYLDPADREAARSLSRALAEIRKRAAAGERRCRALARAAEGLILAHPQNRLDYLEFVHAETLEPVERVDRHTVALVAVHVGDRARLIDNTRVLGPSSLDEVLT